MEYIGFFLIVLLLVTVHEFGHFAAAKLFKLPVELFSLGFGKPIYQTHVWGCEFRLSQIPLGGYVKLQLDHDEDFYQIAATKRIGYFLGGPIANLLLAWLLVALANLASGQALNLQTLITSVDQTVYLVRFLFELIGTAVAEPSQLSGLINTVLVGGQVMGAELYQLFYFLALLSVNLGVFNLLPIPPLDGGKVLLILIERYNSRGIELGMNLTGWVVVLGLIVFTTASDVVRLVN